MDSKGQTKKTRILSIDVMRGITLFLMLFVNDLYTSGVPSWLIHTEAHMDGMGLADWVFPGFLFMVGVSVPYAIAAREKKGEGRLRVLIHIVLRTLSLLLIGVLILNSSRINPDLTGMSRLLWSGLLYFCIFLIWNFYPSEGKWRFLAKSGQVLGLLGLCCLVYLFQAGTTENPSWLEIGWWGILGLIGWGYFTAAIVYLLLRERIGGVTVALLFFVGLNIMTQQGVLHFWKPVSQIFGVVLAGNIPSIVLAGLVIGLMIRRFSGEPKKLLIWIVISSVFCFGFGFILRNWFIISKIYGTPSWSMICNGISIFVLGIIYYVVDVKRRKVGSKLFEETGKNSLTTYLAPDVVYFICWGFSLPVFFYKQVDNQMLAVGGSLIWAYAMLWFSLLLTKLHIRLKL
jgi:heparan-alpha-glucosaminide N-acetyltransferase